MGPLPWSPDGKQIALVRGGDIYIMETDGANVRQLTANDKLDALPTWSPDGRYIAFQSDREGESQEIYVMEADGPNVQRLTEHMAFMAAWSPMPQ